VTITGGSSLPKEDIDRMVREAEEHAAEDKKRREEADTRNQAEQAVYSSPLRASLTASTSFWTAARVSSEILSASSLSSFSVA